MVCCAAFFVLVPSASITESRPCTTAGMWRTCNVSANGSQAQEVFICCPSSCTPCSNVSCWHGYPLQEECCPAAILLRRKCCANASSAPRILSSTRPSSHMLHDHCHEATTHRHTNFASFSARMHAHLDAAHARVLPVIRKRGKPDSQSVPAGTVGLQLVDSQRNYSWVKAVPLDHTQHPLALASCLLSRSSKAPQVPPAPSQLSQILREGGIIHFTHLRRTSGSVLENLLLFPLLATMNPPKAAFNCREGCEGRFAHARAALNETIAAKLSVSRLTFRHCPHGLHTLVPRTRPYTYITILREPAQRMLSWYEFCCNIPGKESCGIPKSLWRNVTGVHSFYSLREKLLNRVDRVTPISEMPFSTHLPPLMEFVLDDNYQTRMLCGGRSHAQVAPIGRDALKCAVENFRSSYAFVGITERISETACLIAHELGLAQTAQYMDSFSVKQQHLSQEVPVGFRLEHGRKYQFDLHLYEVAAGIFERKLQMRPVCKIWAEIQARKKPSDLTVCRSILATDDSSRKIEPASILDHLQAVCHGAKCGNHSLFGYTSNASSNAPSNASSNESSDDSARRRGKEKMARPWGKTSPLATR